MSHIVQKKKNNIKSYGFLESIWILWKFEIQTGNILFLSFTTRKDTQSTLSLSLPSTEIKGVHYHHPTTHFLSNSTDGGFRDKVSHSWLTLDSVCSQAELLLCLPLRSGEYTHVLPCLSCLSFLDIFFKHHSALRHRHTVSVCSQQLGVA